MLVNQHMRKFVLRTSSQEEERRRVAGSLSMRVPFDLPSEHNVINFATFH